MRLQQSKMIKKSYQNSKNAWKIDPKTSSAQKEILKQIIDSSTLETLKSKKIPSVNNLSKNYFPVKSMTSNYNQSSKLNHESQKKNIILQSEIQKRGNSQNGPKIISRSLPRSPMNKREKSQEVDIYKSCLLYTSDAADE